MADITVTAAQVAVLDPCKAEIQTLIADATITAGQLVYVKTTGKLGVADADGSSPLPQAKGVALNGGGAGQAIDVLKRGFCAGFSVSSKSAGDKLYASATAGAVADTQTASLAAIAQVMATSDSTPTLMPYFEFNWTAGY